MQIRKLTSVSEAEARKMFEWESDAENAFYGGPRKGPDAVPRFKTWQEHFHALNHSNAHRFGIYDGSEFVGEFNFVFDHEVLLKREPKTAWVGIGIGDARYRGQGIGTLAMERLEREVAALDGQRIELGVFGFNRPAIQFYEKLGYVRFAELPDFTWWNGAWWPDLRYEKFMKR